MGHKSKTRSQTMKGNKNGTKLKIPEVRQEAFKQYMAHIAEGYPRQAWCFEHPEFTCTWETMDKYIADNPAEFPIIHRQMAKSKAYKKWFEEGKQMATGVKEKCQPAVYQMIMRNMFNWDKENSVQKETTEPLIKTLAKKWRGNSE